MSSGNEAEEDKGHGEREGRGASLMPLEGTHRCVTLRGEVKFYGASRLGMASCIAALLSHSI